MKAIQKAVADYLSAATGAPAVEERTRCRSYPCLAVEVQTGGAVLLCGGRQAERTYRVAVSILSDRERAGQKELAERAAQALLSGIPFGSRVLHPEEVRTEGDRLDFTVTLCQLLDRNDPQPQRMEHLFVEFQ